MEKDISSTIIASTASGTQPEKPFSCATCNKKYFSAFWLEKHIEKCHVNRKERECKICGKILTRKSDLEKHKAIHSGVKAHSCNICEKKFADKFALNMHVAALHAQEKPHQCESCDKKFSLPSLLKRHMKAHQQPVKTFECPLCKKYVGKLKAHIRTHTNEKPHECHLCGKPFASTSHLSDHMRLHTGIKPFKCDICKKAYACSSRLARHAKTHSPIVNIKCEI